MSRKRVIAALTASLGSVALVLFGITAAAPAMAQTIPPAGCVGVIDNGGSGIPLHDNGHNVQVSTTRTAQCYSFIDSDTVGGVTYWQLEDQSSLCLNVSSGKVYSDSCPVDDTNEQFTVTGTNNNELKNRATGDYLTAASLSSGALVTVNASGTATAENQWYFNNPSEHVIPALFENYNATDWTTLENSEPYGVVSQAVTEVCDPLGNCGGAGTEKNTNWYNTLNTMSGDGITPLYYIDTAFDATPLATIETEIDNAETWYGGIQGDGLGFMFDETATNDATYYQSIYNYVETTYGAPIMMFNAGAAPTSSSYYFGSHAILQVFEGSETAWQAASGTFPSWMATEPPAYFSAAVSAGTSGQLGTDFSDAVASNIGNLYINDETTNPPPYNTLPSFLNTELLDAANTI